MVKAVYPTPHAGNLESQRNVQYICLELLLSFVNDMAARANTVGFFFPFCYLVISLHLKFLSYRTISLRPGHR